MNLYQDNGLYVKTRIPRVSGGEPIPINTEAVNIRIPRVGGGEPGDAGTAKTFLTYSPRGRG